MLVQWAVAVQGCIGFQVPVPAALHALGSMPLFPVSRPHAAAGSPSQRKRGGSAAATSGTPSTPAHFVTIAYRPVIRLLAGAVPPTRR